MRGMLFSDFGPQTVILTGLSSVNTFSNVPVFCSSVRGRRFREGAGSLRRRTGWMESGSPALCVGERHG
jgi:hypothetical protein